MADQVEIAWDRVAAVAVGVVVIALVARGVSAALGVASHELRYQAGDPGAWIKRFW